MEVRELVKTTVLPALTADDALKALKEYEEFKAKIAEPSDIQVIQGKQYLKKSFWRKLGNFYALKVDCIRDDKSDEEKFGLTFYATYRATAPNGAHTDGDGACSITEKGLPKTPHIARAIAHTRAKNRAISDLVGGGEVSAEEMVDAVDAEYTEETTQQTRTVEPGAITDDTLSALRDFKATLDEKVGKDQADGYYKGLKRQASAEFKKFIKHSFTEATEAQGQWAINQIKAKLEA